MTDTAPVQYQVLARKYRPETFTDLVGQDAMVRTLKNAFDADRIKGSVDLALQVTEVLAGQDPGPEGADFALGLEAAEAVEFKIETGLAHTVQLLGDVVHRPVVDLTDEAECQVKVLFRDPTGAGETAAQPGECGADMVGKRKRNEQPVHT